MSKVDWSKAPDWAIGYGRHHYRNYWVGVHQAASVTSPCMVKKYSNEFNISCFLNYQVNPANNPWPSESRIDIIGTNGNTAEHYMDETLHQTAKVHYETQAELAARIKAELEVKQKAEAQAKPQNKYDREIIGKYGSGKCIVDVYRVLVAFGDIPPEIQHAIKKLLAGGKRGHKDEGLDYLEAIQSIEAYLNRLDDSSDQLKTV